MAIQIRTTLDEPDTETSFVPHRPARPDKSEGGRPFKLVSDYEPSGDQCTAIPELVEQALAGERDEDDSTGEEQREALPNALFQIERGRYARRNKGHEDIHLSPSNCRKNASEELDLSLFRHVPDGD